MTTLLINNTIQSIQMYHGSLKVPFNFPDYIPIKPLSAPTAPNNFLSAFDGLDARGTIWRNAEEWAFFCSKVGPQKFKLIEMKSS